MARSEAQSRGMPRAKRPRKTKTQDAEQRLADTLDLIRMATPGVLTTFERQYLYVPGRKFSADFAWPEQRVLVEVQGGVWVDKSGHSGGTGIKRDNERLNFASINNWRMLRFTTADVTSHIGDVIDTIEDALGLPRSSRGGTVALPPQN